MRFYVQFGPRREYKDYTPGDDLEEQIAEHRNDPGKPCQFVECPYRHPDYRAFDEKQLAYYLYIRDSLRNGPLARSDDGYNWLLLVELINDREDPEATMALLRRLYDAGHGSDSKGYPAPATISEIMFCYAVANGLDLPRIYVYGDVWPKALISEVLLPYPEQIPPEAFSTVVGYPLENYWNEDAEDLDPGELFDAALPAVDDCLRDSTGRGILETYGNGRKTSMVTLFDGYDLASAYFGEKQTSITYTDSDKSLELFLCAMYRYCEKVLEKDAGVGKGPSVSTVFDKDLRKVVDRVFNHGDIIRATYHPKTSRGTERGLQSGPEEAPIVVPLSVNNRYTLPQAFEADLIAYSREEPDGPCGYVCSGSSRPDFRHMSPEAVQYYLYWRGLAREGRFGRTDEGYIWLYECELINDTTVSKETSLERLAGLARAYNQFFDIEYDFFGSTTKKPGLAYMDYAFVNFPLIPDPTLYPCGLSACDMLEQLLDGRDVPVIAMDFCILAGLQGNRKSDQTLMASFNDDCARIAARAIQAIDSEGRSKSGQIRGYCRLRSKKIKMDVFVNLKYYHWPTGRVKAIERSILNSWENETFNAELRSLMKAVVQASKSPGKRQKEAWAFGVEVSGIVARAVDECTSEKRAADAAEEARTMVIDRGGVQLAEKDLNHVTELVGIEKAIEESEEAPPVQTADVPVDAWAAFLERLGRGQKEYLARIVSGEEVAVKPVLEGAINTAAMDTVKDAVVEDGRVFDEYVEDLRRILKEM